MARSGQYLAIHRVVMDAVALDQLLHRDAGRAVAHAVGLGLGSPIAASIVTKRVVARPGMGRF